jgi:hypothetical protein
MQIALSGSIHVPNSLSKKECKKLREVLRNDIMVEIEALSQEYGVTLKWIEVE